MTNLLLHLSESEIDDLLVLERGGGPYGFDTGGEAVEAAWKLSREYHLAKGQPQRTKAIALGVVAVRRAEGVGVGSGFSDAQFGQAGAEPARAAATVRARLVPGGQVVSEPVAA